MTPRARTPASRRSSRCDRPRGAPNVLVVLLDDVGFGASSAPISTPTAERLADGLKYTRFHTTALCSPTRQALLTGRNHHSVGMGGITEIAASAPGYNSIRPNTTAQLNWFQIDLDAAAEDLDHLITPEERLQIAMARQ